MPGAPWLTTLRAAGKSGPAANAWDDNHKTWPQDLRPNGHNTWNIWQHYLSTKKGARATQPMVAQCCFQPRSDDSCSAGQDHISSYIIYIYIYDIYIYIYTNNTTHIYIYIYIYTYGWRVALLDSFRTGSGQAGVITEVPQFPTIDVHVNMYGICGKMRALTQYRAKCLVFSALV